MKALVTYYSFSGNTDKVVKIFSEVLRRRGDLEVQRLKPKDEITKFGAQCKAAFTGKRAELEGPVTFDAAPYDLVLIGSPVWAFAPPPALNTYLDNICGLNGKRVVVLLTSGSGLGVGRCFRNIRKALEDKGASRIDEINIPEGRLNDTAFMTSSMEKAL